MMFKTKEKQFVELSTKAILLDEQVELTSGKRNKVRLGGEARSSSRILLAICPPLIILGTFYFYPMISILVTAFTHPTPGMQNFEWFFGQPVNMAVLIRTITISFGVMVLCVLVAYPFSYYMTIATAKTRNLLMLAVLVPFVTSTVVRTFAWVILLQKQGPIVQFASMLGFGDVEILRTPLAVFIGMAQVLLPFVVLPMYSTMAQIDRRLLTAAVSLGATRRKAFMTVFLPLSIPGVAAGALLCFVMALGFYITPAMLGSSRETFLSTLIQGQVQGLGQWGHGAAIAIVLLATTVLILVVAGLIGRRHGSASVNMLGGSK